MFWETLVTKVLPAACIAVFAIASASILINILLMISGGRETRQITEPTGAEAVIYENDEGVVVEKNTDRGWMDVSRIQSLRTLFSTPDNITDAKLRVSKNGEIVDVRADFGIVYVSKSGLAVNESNYHLVQFTVTKITLIEMESKTEVLSKEKKILRNLFRSIGNQIVVEYEITNEEDLARDMVTKAQTKEILRQLLSPTKGDRQ